MKAVNGGLVGIGADGPRSKLAGRDPLNAENAAGRMSALCRRQPDAFVRLSAPLGAYQRRRGRRNHLARSRRIQRVRRETLGCETSCTQAWVWVFAPRAKRPRTSSGARASRERDGGRRAAGQRWLEAVHLVGPRGRTARGARIELGERHLLPLGLLLGSERRRLLRRWVHGGGAGWLGGTRALACAACDEQRRKGDLQWQWRSGTGPCRVG